MLDSLYGQVMRARRQWVEHHPERRQHLARPVISVGNLSMGGTGKSPVVAAIGPPFSVAVTAAPTPLTVWLSCRMGRGCSKVWRDPATSR